MFSRSIGLIFLCLSFVTSTTSALTGHGEPFLIKVNNETAIIGNDLWNATIGRQYGTKLMYKGVDLVGNAVGHYVSYSQLSPIVIQESALI